MVKESWHFLFWGTIYLKYLQKICNEYADAVAKKYKNITQLKDDNGLGVEDIVKGMDQLGKSIMHKE